MEIITKSASETQKLGEHFGSYLKNFNKNSPQPFLIILDGELGSGKTTFVKGIASGLGIPRRVLSPTFTLVREYQLPSPNIFSKLIHLDWYKLNESEINDLHLDEIFVASAVIVIEWAKRVDQLPTPAQITFEFTALDDGSHKIEIKDDKTDFSNFLNAITVLNQGGIIIYPTDTAYGIGCRIDKIEVVKRLFQIRKRPQNMPVPVLVASIEMAQKYLTPLPMEVKKLMKEHWPGGLTIVYNCLVEKVPVQVRANGKTLGVRMPDHRDTLNLIETVGVPILGPSANFHGFATPYDLKDLDPELVKQVDYVLPGEVKHKKASTLVDCTQKPWKILRQGAVEL